MKKIIEIQSLNGGIGKKYVHLVSDKNNEKIVEKGLETHYYLKINNFLKIKSILKELVLVYSLLEEIFPQKKELSSFTCKSLLGKDYELYKKYKPLGITIK